MKDELQLMLEKKYGPLELLKSQHIINKSISHYRIIGTDKILEVIIKEK